MNYTKGPWFIASFETQDKTKKYGVLAPVSRKSLTGPLLLPDAMLISKAQELAYLLNWVKCWCPPEVKDQITALLGDAGFNPPDVGDV